MSRRQGPKPMVARVLSPVSAPTKNKCIVPIHIRQKEDVENLCPKIQSFFAQMLLVGARIMCHVIAICKVK